MALGDYPSWIYDPLGVNPPTRVLNDAAFQAAITGTAASVSAIQTEAPVSIAVIEPVAAAFVVTQGIAVLPNPLAARWAKNPPFDAQKR